MTFPFNGRDGPVRIEPIEVIPLRALVPAADEIANELVARLLLRLRSPR